MARTAVQPYSADDHDNDRRDNYQLIPRLART